MAVTTTTTDIERARTMLAQGDNKKASRLLADVAIACRDAEQAREIKTIAEEGLAGAGMFGKSQLEGSHPAGRAPRRVAAPPRAVPRRPSPSRSGAAAQLLSRTHRGGQGCGRTSFAAIRRIVSNP